MRLRRSRPARWASTTRSWSIWTLNLPLGNFSKTVPVTSILSSLLIDLRGGFAGGGAPHSWGGPPAFATNRPLRWLPAAPSDRALLRTPHWRLHPGFGNLPSGWPRNARRRLLRSPVG